MSIKKIIMNSGGGQPQNKIMQIRKVVKPTDQERALRDQLHTEIENKSKACSNPTFECSIPRVEGYEYCIRHILQDTRAPYKQCTYIYQTGKKCNQAAPKHDVKKDPQLTTFCFEHSRLVQLTKTRNSVGKYKTIESNEALLNDISHHLDIDKAAPNVSNNFISDLDEEIDVVSPNVQAFISYSDVKDLETINETLKSRKRILDYASDSSSDDDIPTLNNTSKTHEWNNSDNESIDSPDEDLLKHAGIYTAEEATLLTKQKLEKLQSLYIEQVHRFHHLLKESRRKYLHSIRKERETLCSIHDQPKNTPHERKLYEKLKSLNHYHRRHGVEAVLYKKLKERRQKANTSANKASGFSKCIFTEGGVKCLDRSLPSCKYCRKHILEDKKQILFRSCAIEKSGIVCQEPVPNIFDEATCVLHIRLPNPRNYMQRKYESETEEDEEELPVIKKEENTSQCRDISQDIKTEHSSLNTDLSTQDVDIKMFTSENITISHEDSVITSHEDSVITSHEDSVITSHEDSVITSHVPALEAQENVTHIEKENRSTEVTNNLKDSEDSTNVQESEVLFEIPVSI